MQEQTETNNKYYLTATEAAKILGVSPETVMISIINGTLPIGFAVRPETRRQKWRCKVVKARLEKYLKGEL